MGRSAGTHTFATLLAEVGRVEGIRRVRFTTSHPRHFTRQIVEVLDEGPTLCDHVHLPVQSGSTRVLAAMQREYTREEYLERIAWIRAAKRELSITTDIIVGFPGETEEDFQQTLSLMDEVQFDGIFSFKYSPRPNTPAILMQDAIPEEEKTRRLNVLNEHQREIQRRNYQRHVGQVVEAMVEGVQHKLGQVPGRTTQNKPLNFTVPEGAARAAVGSYVRVRVTRAHPNSLVGEMLTAETDAIIREDDTMEIEMRIRGLMLDPSTNMPIIVLKDVNSDSVLPIWVGVFEANAIALEIEKSAPPRPMTHDLLKNVILGLGAVMDRVVVTELRNDTFYACIWATRDGQPIRIDSRPSDAIALAMRTDAPIYVEESVLASSRLPPAAQDASPATICGAGWKA